MNQKKRYASSDFSLSKHTHSSGTLKTDLLVQIRLVSVTINNSWHGETPLGSAWARKQNCLQLAYRNATFASAGMDISEWKSTVCLLSHTGEMLREPFISNLFFQGNRIETAVPPIGSLSSFTCAWWTWAICLTIARPKPVPLVCRECLLSTR